MDVTTIRDALKRFKINWDDEKAAKAELVRILDDEELEDEERSALREAIATMKGKETEKKVLEVKAEEPKVAVESAAPKLPTPSPLRAITDGDDNQETPLQTKVRELAAGEIVETFKTSYTLAIEKGTYPYRLEKYTGSRRKIKTFKLGSLAYRGASNGTYDKPMFDDISSLVDQTTEPTTHRALLTLEDAILVAGHVEAAMDNKFNASFADIDPDAAGMTRDLVSRLHKEDKRWNARSKGLVSTHASAPLTVYGPVIHPYGTSCSNPNDDRIHDSDVAFTIAEKDSMSYYQKCEITERVGTYMTEEEFSIVRGAHHVVVDAREKPYKRGLTTYLPARERIMLPGVRSRAPRMCSFIPDVRAKSRSVMQKRYSSNYGTKSMWPSSRIGGKPRPSVSGAASAQFLHDLMMMIVGGVATKVATRILTDESDNMMGLIMMAMTPDFIWLQDTIQSITNAASYFPTNDRMHVDIISEFYKTKAKATWVYVPRDLDDPLDRPGIFLPSAFALRKKGKPAEAWSGEGEYELVVLNDLRYLTITPSIIRMMTAWLTHIYSFMNAFKPFFLTDLKKNATDDIIQPLVAAGFCQGCLDAAIAAVDFSFPAGDYVPTQEVISMDVNGAVSFLHAGIEEGAKYISHGGMMPLVVVENPEKPVSQQLMMVQQGTWMLFVEFVLMFMVDVRVMEQYEFKNVAATDVLLCRLVQKVWKVADKVILDWVGALRANSVLENYGVNRDVRDFFTRYWLTNVPLASVCEPFRVRVDLGTRFVPLYDDMEDVLRPDIASNVKDVSVETLMRLTQDGLLKDTFSAVELIEALIVEGRRKGEVMVDGFRLPARAYVSDVELKRHTGGKIPSPKLALEYKGQTYIGLKPFSMPYRLFEVSLRTTSGRSVEIYTDVIHDALPSNVLQQVLTDSDYNVKFVDAATETSVVGPTLQTFIVMPVEYFEFKLR